jgi:hypothetical protein
VDDTLVAKPHRKANNFVGWYFDHTKNRTTKGNNVLTLLYHGGGNSVPVSAEIIKRELVFGVCYRTVARLNWQMQM